MDGLNGVIFVEALHYFPFILMNLVVALSNIDSAMEESAQNLGASGFRLFRRIVFPLAMPGYIAGASLVFVKVFDDLGTPLVLNVTNMLAPQAYLRITSIGHRGPDRLRDQRADDRVFAVRAVGLRPRPQGPRLRDAAARRLESREAQAHALAGGRSPTPGSALVLLLVLSPHLGILLLSFAKVWSFSVLPDAYTLAALRHRLPGLAAHDLEHDALLRSRRADRRDPRHRHRLPHPAHARCPSAARSISWRALRSRSPASCSRSGICARSAASSCRFTRRSLTSSWLLLVHRLRRAAAALRAALVHGGAAAAPRLAGRGRGEPRRDRSGAR